MKHTQPTIFYILLLFVLAISCSPVHYLSNVKRTPREYVMNYCSQPIKAPRSEWIKEPWIVFSDRDNNHTTARPGGKVKVKEAAFMEPFLVIGEDGDYLKLITYNAETKNGYLKGKSKEAEFAGWVHRSRLLLSRQAHTDLASGLKNKYITVLTDTLALTEPDKYLAADSLKTFRDIALTKEGKAVGFNQLVYLLKISSDNRKYLIANKQSLSVDNAADDVIGWIPSSMAQLFGRRSFAQASSLPRPMLEIKQAINNSKNKFKLTLEEYQESDYIRDEFDVYKYSPVIRYTEPGDSLIFKIGSPVDIIDRSNNFIYNVNGNKITYRQYREMNKELENINVVFIIQGADYTAEQFAPVVNVIQNLQNFFDGEIETSTYKYKFGSVIAMNEGDSIPISSFGLTTDYQGMLSFLSKKAGVAYSFKELTPENRWDGIKQALEMVENYPTETNVLVIIGEKGSVKETSEAELIEKLGEYNCRLLGFQISAKDGAEYNNFVLQMSDMIEQSAKLVGRNKRDKIVYAEQLKDDQYFKESDKNIYHLDFPERSMSQGWLLFPEKDKNLPLNLLSASIDSIIYEIKDDNKILLNSLKKGFNSVGNNQSKFNNTVARFNSIDTSRTISKAFLRKFEKQTPIFYLPTRTGKVSQFGVVSYRWVLMLGTDEYEELKGFLEELTMEEVDYTMASETKKQQMRNPCNCPDDDLYYSTITAEDTDSTKHEYASTKKIRKAMYKAYMRELDNCYYCKRDTKTLKNYTLAQAHEKIFGIPSRTPIMTKYSVRDLKDKSVMPDVMLERLIEYLMERKDMLEKQGEGISTFESGGQTYYWINETALP